MKKFHDWIQYYDEICDHIDDDIIETCDRIYDITDDTIEPSDRWAVTAAQLYAARYYPDLLED